MFSGNEWTGRTGDAWADEWHRTDRSFAGLNSALNAAILAVAPATGSAVDLGCGAGETAIAIAAARSALNVTGLDISPNLVAVARERGAEIANLHFAVADTGALDPGTRADLFLSRHGVMFFDDPFAALMVIRKAANPGARLVFSCFRDPRANPWASLGDQMIGATPASSSTTDYTPGPFGFADCDFVTRLLAQSGWRDAAAQAVDYQYIAGAGQDPIADAAGFFTRIGPVARTLAEQPPECRPALIERLKSLLAPHVVNGAVALPAAAWIWTAQAGETA